MREIELLKTARTLVLKVVEGASPAQLLHIPAGFKNNLLWNALHLLATQQILHYKLAQLPMHLSEDFVALVRKGTSPTDWTSPLELHPYKELFLSLPEQLEADYKAGKFSQFTPYKTSTGFELKNIEDAIQFNNFHEGIHLGVMLAIRKFV